MQTSISGNSMNATAPATENNPVNVQLTVVEQETTKAVNSYIAGKVGENNEINFEVFGETSPIGGRAKVTSSAHGKVVETSVTANGETVTKIGDELVITVKTNGEFTIDNL